MVGASDVENTAVHCNGRELIHSEAVSLVIVTWKDAQRHGSTVHQDRLRSRKGEQMTKRKGGLDRNGEK